MRNFNVFSLSSQVFVVTKIFSKEIDYSRSSKKCRKVTSCRGMDSVLENQHKLVKEVCLFLAERRKDCSESLGADRANTTLSNHKLLRTGGKLLPYLMNIHPYSDWTNLCQAPSCNHCLISNQS